MVERIGRLMPPQVEDAPQGIRDPDVESRLVVCRESGQGEFLRHEAFWAATGLHRAPSKTESALMRSIAPEFGIEPTKPSLRIPLAKLDGYVDRLVEEITLEEREMTMQKLPAEERPKAAIVAPTPPEKKHQAAELLTKEEVPVFVERAIKQDKEAFGRLYDTYVDRVYRHIYYRVGNPEDAEDLTAQTFENAFRAMGRYRQMGSPFIVWLLSIANNEVIDHYRGSKRFPLSSIEQGFEEYGIELSDRGKSPQDHAEQNYTAEELRRAVLRLSLIRQKILVMRFVEGMDYDKIAEIVEKSEGSVRIAKYRALRELRGILENNSNGH